MINRFALSLLCIELDRTRNVRGHATLYTTQSYMNDVKLDNVQLVKHLGHILTSDLSDDKDIMHQTSMYNRMFSWSCEL